MAAVCETEHFRERIAANPDNRHRLMAMEPERFIAQMTQWQKGFLAGADLPVIGASEDELKSLNIPTLIIPGNDKTHGQQTGETAHALIRNSVLIHLFTEQLDIDVAPMEDWHAKTKEHAGALLNFLHRHRMGPAPAPPGTLLRVAP
jgi:hypothetical protein